MTAIRYVEEILRLHVIPMRRQMGYNFVLMQNNARPHTARIALNFLEESNIEVLLWNGVVREVIGKVEALSE